MPRPLLDQIDRRELGDFYKPADADKYFKAHQLIERYFANADDRKGTIASLESLEIDAAIIGRLSRVRPDWPDLKAGVYYINEHFGSFDVRYFLGIPKGYERATALPLVIQLPTADAFVNEPRPDPLQAAEIYRAWMSDELTRHPDAVLIMPLLNLEVLWGPTYTGMNNVIQPMLHAMGRANIDPARVYLLGHGMSAHAVWNLGLHYPTYFAAINPLAGAASAEWQRLRFMNLRNVLPVVWHDAGDDVTKVDAARQIVRVLRDLKVDVDYAESRNIGHVPTEAIVEQSRQKMFARTRQLYPKQVSIQSNRPDAMFNRNDWVQIYQPLNTGKEEHLLFSRGGGTMTVYAAAYSVNASIDKNTINVTSTNVQSMRFYLNEQMVDMNRAVSVVVNRKPRFEAVLKPNFEQMLKDQLFIGRGWRYYTAIVDIDFGTVR